LHAEIIPRKGALVKFKKSGILIFVKKILIIDDEKEFCDMIKEELETATSFEVEICTHGSQAVDRVKAVNPDLILLDIMMPEKTGPEIASQLKNLENTKKIPIIFLTAVIAEAEAEKNKHLIGGEYFLGKPVKMEELLYMLSRLLG